MTDKKDDQAMAVITRRIEFDAGHRIPDHQSKCRSAHGHRYVLEASVFGAIIDAEGSPENGMVTDFSKLKQVMMEEIHDAWDHGFLVYKHDHRMMHALDTMSDPGFVNKTVVLPLVPTAENLAWLAFQKIRKRLLGSDFELQRVRLYETPNCYADCFK